MALATEITRTEDIPWEPGQSMTFRHPGWLGLSQARQERSRSALRAMRETREAAGAEVIAELRKGQEEAAEKAEKPAEDAPPKELTAADVLAEYDVETLLNLGIGAWTYAAPCTPTQIANLDDLTATWAGLWIAALAKSALRPIGPVCEQKDGQWEVRPGTPDPTARSLISIGSSQN